jgi:hypothetical protein
VPLGTHHVLLGCVLQAWLYVASADRLSCRMWRAVLCCAVSSV